MPPRAHSSPSRPWSAGIAVLALALTASGCLVDVRLAADASGTLVLRYHLDDQATLGVVADRLAGPAVVVRSGRIDAAGVGTFKLAFADLQALSSTAMFKNVSVTRGPGPEPGTTAVVARFVQPKPIRLTPEQLQHYGSEVKVVVTLPGPIVTTNATTRDGETLTWVVPLQALLTDPETVFSATYRAPGHASAAG